MCGELLMRLTSAIGQPSIIDRRIYDMDLIVGKVKKKKKFIRFEEWNARILLQISLLFIDLSG